MASDITYSSDLAGSKDLVDSVSDEILSQDYFEDQSKEEVITKRDLWKISIRGLFMEGNFNYERMQAGGWAYTLIPILKKIHKNKNDLAKSLKMHMELFNASPKLFTFIVGLVAAMEQNKEKPSTIRSLKVAAMGPSGGIGDAIDHMTLMPITLGIGASIALDGSLAGPFVFFFLYQMIHYPLYFWLTFYGYKSGVNALAQLKEKTVLLSRAATILGLTVVGALSASFIKISTPLVIEAGKASVQVQTDLLDKIMPNLLPLSFVFIMYYLVQKGKSPSALIGLTMVIGIAGKYLGFL